MIDVAWAQAGAGGSPPALVTFLPLILVFVVFYFLLIRPQQQKQKNHEMMLANLKKNDKVVTAGGLHGRVVALTEHVVTLEISTSPSVRVEVSRPQINTVLTPPGRTDDKSKDKEKEKKSE